MPERKCWSVGGSVGGAVPCRAPAQRPQVSGKELGWRRLGSSSCEKKNIKKKIREWIGEELDVWKEEFDLYFKQRDSYLSFFSRSKRSAINLEAFLLLPYLFNAAMSCCCGEVSLPLCHMNYSFFSWQFRVFTAPFHKVGFADFWLADQLNSLVVILMDLEYMICFYSFEVQWENNAGLLADTGRGMLTPLRMLSEWPEKHQAKPLLGHLCWRGLPVT